MSCECGGKCGGQSTDLLAGLSSGLGSVEGWSGGALPAGVTFSQGLHLTTPTDWPRQEVAWEIEGCLYGSGSFSELVISQPTTSLLNEYWQIDGRTAEGFGQAQDLQNQITGWIQSCAVSVQINSNGVFPLRINTAPRLDQGSGQQVDVPVTPPPGERDQGKCQAGQIYRGWLYGCQPAQCPAGQVYKENWFSAGCRPVGEKTWLEELGLSTGNAAMVGVIGALAVVVLILKK